MNQNDPISIRLVANGWFVRPDYDHTSDDVFVFETFDGMKVWLTEHFAAEQEKQPGVIESTLRDHFKEKPEPLSPWFDRPIMTATEVERRNDEHRFEEYRKRFEESARLRYLNTFGADAMTEAEARARGG